VYQLTVGAIVNVVDLSVACFDLPEQPPGRDERSPGWKLRPLQVNWSHLLAHLWKVRQG